MEVHPSVMNTDILHEIFAHLTGFSCRSSNMEEWREQVGIERRNRATLVNAALCCKTFSSPALDALWWKLDDICHLFFLLPSFSQAGSSYMLDGAVTDKDWERFDLYAKRVRFLVLHDFGTIHPSVYLRIFQLKKFSSILPNVQKINSMPGGSGLLSVLSTSLLELEIFPDSKEEIFPTVLASIEAIPESSSRLQKLHIKAALSQACLSAFPRMTHLRELSIMFTTIRDLGFFFSMSTLENLETFKISRFEEPSILPPLSTGTSPSQPFPALRTLEIDASPSQINSLFKIFKHHPLQRLELRETDNSFSSFEESWAQVIQSTASKFYSLKNLTVISSHNGKETLPSQFNIFEALLEMHGLESVHLDFPWLLFSDVEFKKMANAWPDLNILRLSGSPGTPNATFAALEALAICCPRLHGLSLSFDARRPPPTTVKDDTLLSFCRMKTFDVQNSPVESTLPVARHLDRLFPNLKTIQSYVNEKIWGEVGPLLQIFKAVRMDQKARDFELIKRARSARRTPSLLE